MNMSSTTANGTLNFSMTSFSTTLSTIFSNTTLSTNNFTNSTTARTIDGGHKSETTSSIVIIRVVIYSLSLFFGITGNGLVITTSIIQRRTLSRSRFLIAHLALTDVIFSLRLPVQIILELNSYIWTYGIFYCKILHSVNSMSMLASIGTMTVIAIERYRGITKPFLAKITRSKLILSLAVVWLIAVISYTPVFMLRTVQNRRCVESHANLLLQKSYSVYVVLVKYIFPLIIICYCYWKIAAEIRKRPKIQETQRSQRRRRERDDNRIVRMLIVMVVAFAVLTLPATIWWLLHDFGGLDRSGAVLQIAEVFGAFVYLHSCVNPVVYYIMDSKFRSDVIQMLKCKGNCQRPGLWSRSRSSSSTVNGGSQKENVGFHDINTHESDSSSKQSKGHQDVSDSKQINGHKNLSDGV